MPTLDREAIRDLFEIVKELGDAPRSAVPMAELISVPASLSGGVAMTVDFTLSRELGREFIVLQVPSPAGPSPDPRLAVLTARESEIAAMIASGLSNKQIAKRLSLSLATIKSHAHHILSKTGLPNRAAVAVAVAGRSDSPVDPDRLPPPASVVYPRSKRRMNRD